jgi:3,4-dihydroxy 2-butanone 4-phosphate synthase/GTP cyclohydrolase II
VADAIAFATIPDALATIRGGGIVVVVDDPDRENEGDFVMAAERVTPAAVNTMITYGRGQVCLPLTAERLEVLRLPALVDAGLQAQETAFTASIDLDEPGTVGISAQDRSRCIARVLAPDARPEDFRRPGHVYPLRARAACCAGPVIRRRRSTWPGSPACSPPGSSARS